MRFVLLVTLIVSAASVSAQQPRFSTSVDLQVVSVIARGADNALVRGLSRDDFELLEDGKPVAITTFAEVNTDARTSVDDGRFVVLLLDDFGTDAAIRNASRRWQRASQTEWAPKT